MANKILAEVSSSPVFKLIATMANRNMDPKVLADATDKFSRQLAEYRESMSENDLKITEVLSEENIMNGVLNPHLLDALTLTTVTVNNLLAFKSLGFTPDVPQFSELDGINIMAYSGLRTAVTNMYNNAIEAFKNDDNDSVYLNILRIGVKVAADAFLSFNKYCAVQGITTVNAGNDADSADALTSLLESHHERYEEWRDITVEETLINLVENPISTTYVAPLGVSEVYEGIKGVSPKLYDDISNFGENTTSLSFAKTTEFLTSLKEMTPEDRQKIIEIITKFNETNSAGTLNTYNGPMSIPAAISMVDVIIGALLYAGEVIISFDEVVGEDLSVMLSAIESEEVLVMIDTLSMEYASFDTPELIAVNTLALPSRFIPQSIFKNALMKFTAIPELTELNNNITDMLFGDLLKEATEKLNNTADIKGDK